jgi:hypothetical protein
LYAAAAFRQGAGCASFTRTGGCVRMTSGGSIIDQPKNFLFLTHIRAFLLKVKKAFYI